ncbi:GNAT family N-acetyltransferase [Variovorax sp. J22G21]|uniref:GNAT family N-acetyltransferase n=1 Tax=Variovorax fucosicus TaxID=3053517 RepID=UPI00257571F2|nr:MULTISPECIES: GNAT family N-acetyltransferase [unclassified Variovorax]MDM0039655.1 GNAT family N-acetyltransferase [Variovorax sp. J22R193]MDM0054734.1 GNAT family N-acetyltransferase [Variovorax sp. J22G47]MDM0064430.1 GNAT family N-acetyltransferase [Variovorax sp. J22G21]
MSKSIPIFRRSGLGDADYLFDLCQMTMRGYVEQVWGVWNEPAVRKHLAERAREGAFFMLYVDGARVGAVEFEHHGTHYQIEDLYVEPQSQGQGIGTFVVKHIIAMATEKNIPVRLRVLTPNPARRLYERLGFEVTRSTPERHFMERRS